MKKSLFLLILVLSCLFLPLESSAQRLWLGLRGGINEANFGEITQRYLFGFDQSRFTITLGSFDNVEFYLGPDIYFETPEGWVIQGGIGYNFKKVKSFSHNSTISFGGVETLLNQGEVEARTGFWNVYVAGGYNFTNKHPRLLISPTVGFRYGNGVEVYQEDIFDIYNISTREVEPNQGWPVNDFYGPTGYFNIGYEFERPYIGVLFSPGLTYLFRGDGTRRPPVFQLDFTVGVYWSVNLY
ncbi:MAG: hypothetical protein AAFU64_10145 [Bacteroidota bacterium]